MKTRERLHVEHLLLAIDLIGTALFAAEGATTAIDAQLDILGVLVLAFVMALGGGLIRDVLLGDVPASSLRDWRYAAIALVTGSLMFVLHTPASTMSGLWLTTLDAAGLSLFAVAGATKSLNFRLHPLLATMMGGITGVGGGTIRDVLINRVPIVLRADVYATAALLGAATAVTMLRWKVAPIIANTGGIVVCFGVRMLAVHYHWNLPGAKL